MDSEEEDELLRQHRADVFNDSVLNWPFDASREDFWDIFEEARSSLGPLCVFMEAELEKAILLEKPMGMIHHIAYVYGAIEHAMVLIEMERDSAVDSP